MINGTVGDDNLTGTPGDDTIDGLAGSDALYGDAGNDLLQGDDGEDFLRGQAGDDTLEGDAGDDFLSGGAGGDRFDGGAGIDRVVFGDATAGVTVDLTQQGSAQNTGLGLDTLIGIEHVGGSNFNDVLTGDANANWLWGTGGSDTMSGGGGDDLVSVGNGAHVVDGGAGVDTLSFYSSTLTSPVNASLALQGSAQNTGQGSMTLSGFENLSGTVIGADTLTGDANANVLAGWGGSDSLSGGDGNDTLLGDGYIHVDSPLGGSGPITTFLEFSDDGIPEAVPGADTLDGGAGDDNLRAGDGNDLLIGGTGADFLRGQTGSDTLQGGADNDFLNGGAGDDVMDGGTGIDRASFGDAGVGVTVDLSITTAQNTGFGSDTLVNFEQVSGTTFNDVLSGDGADNWLWGSGGADTMSGGGGNDLVSVGNGAAQVDGGAGVDTLSFYSSTLVTPIVASLAAQGSAQDTHQGMMTISGFENLSGTAIGADTLTGDAADNVLAGWGGGDSLAGGGGNDTLLGDGYIHVDSPLGGAGAITTFLEFSADGIDGAAPGADTLDGGTGDDNLRAGDGNDLLQGGAGSDFLRGQAGADTLQGGADDDFLNGGAGDDQMDGGAGIDRVSFGDATGPVTVDLNLQGSAQNTGFGSDTLIGIEQVSGSAFNDVLTGDANDNWLWGLGGVDTMSGGGGNDLVSVGAGAQVVSGGAGVDTLSYYTNTLTGPVNVSLALQGAAQNTLQGSMTISSFENLVGTPIGSDTLTGDAADNVLAGWGGRDSLLGGDGADLLLGDGHIHVDSALGGAGPITTFETFSDDGIAGAEPGNDTLAGGDGDDTLKGGTGNDVLDGGAGADRAVAGAAAGQVTTVTLGAGADTLELGADLAGTVTVADFQAGAGGDVIDMAAFLTAKLTAGWNGTDNPFTTGHLRLVQDGAATLIQIDVNGGGDGFATVVRLDDTSSLALTAANLGYAPPSAAAGGTTGDSFEWTPDSPATVVDGGAGVDVVTITAPAVVSGPATIKASPDGTALLFDLDGDGTTDLTVTNVEDVVLNGERVVITGDLSGTGLAPNTIHYVGTAGDNLLDASGMTSAESIEAQGFAGADTLIGGLADDRLEGGAGNDTLDGGADTDTAVFSGARSSYTITVLAGGEVQVVGPDGADVLSHIERLEFSDGTWGQNQAPAGADAAVSVNVGSTRTITAANFGFTDGQGDTLAAVRVATLPATGDLKLSGVAVTAGQVIAAADIAGGHLTYAPAGAGAASFTFQVQDNGLVGWGTNEDATPNTLTINASTPTPPSSGGGGSPPPPIGTAGNDVIVLDTTVRSYSAGDGDDNVTGSYMDDTLRGEAGADTLNGGAGNDTVEGGAGTSYLRGNEGDDVVTGGDAFDDAHGNQGNDTVSGGGGDDWVVGGKDQDVLFGDAGADIVYGNLGDDTCSGGDGADIVRGGQGNDTLTGGAGADWLAGDRGDDTMTGGAGADVFHTWSEAGIDRVLDFNAAEGDRVNLLPGTTYSVAQVGADTVIDLGAGNQMVLVGVQLSGLPNGWIFGS